MLPTLRLLDCLVALLLTGPLVYLWIKKSRSLPLPPGPRGLPWIGIGFKAPKADSIATYTRWSEIYGPLYHFTAFGESTIVLNSTEVALELLERRGASYVDRPRRRLFDYAGLQDGLGTGSSYDSRMQKMRRMVISAYGKDSAERWEHILSEERHRFLRRVHEDPGNVVKHIFMSTAASIADATYGYDVKDPKDPTIGLLMGGQSALVKILRTQSTLTEAFRIFQYLPHFFPGTRLYQDAAHSRDQIRSANEQLVAGVKQKLAAGIARPSYLANLLDDADLTPEKEKLAVWSSFSVFFAGFGTNSVAIHGFIVAMMLYPQVQARAQEELDSIVGHQRLPVLEDRSRLPYTSALVKEVLRWSPPSSIGIQHRARKDDIYMGYLIPKGATMLTNLVAILSDPKVYSSPAVFDPTRFLGPSPERDPADFAFGFGPRACPSSTFGEASLFLHAAAVLSVFKITQAKGTPPIDPLRPSERPAFPSPIPCAFELRSEAAQSLVNAAENRGEVSVA